MTADPGHEEVAELLGAYALDAVDREERVAVESHLASCPACVTEVAGHLRVAAALVADGRTGSALSVPPDGRPRWRRVTVLRVATAAAALAAVALAAVTAGSIASETTLRHRVNQIQAQTSAASVVGDAELATADPSARRVPLVAGDGQPVLVAVAGPAGPAFLIDSRLPTLPPAQTYELWRIEGDQRVPAATLGQAPRVIEFAMTSRTVALVVTVEPAGGSATSDRPPVAQGATAS